MKRLNRLRIDAGLTIADVARAAGVDDAVACGWLSGTSWPDDREQSILAALFDVHPDELDEPELDEQPRRIDRIRNRLSTSVFRATMSG